MLSTCIPHFLRAAVLAALLLVAGCQSAPVQEMSDARQAITVAREAGAEQYAAELLRAATDSLQSAEGFLNERRFEMARRDAVNAKNNALDALRQSESSRETEAP